MNIIPNGQIDKVTVLTRDWSRSCSTSMSPTGRDLDAATASIKREFDAYAAEHPDFVLEPPEILGVQNLAESSVQIRAQMKLLPGKQWPAGRELRLRVKKALDAAGIDIPFPQRTVWLRQDKAE